jgi:4-hydroxy-2-oxoheptanedioate aldolase
MSQPGDVVRNSVKEKLQRGEVVASITVRLVATVEVVRIAKSAGTDLGFLMAEAQRRAKQVRDIRL